MSGEGAFGSRLKKERESRGVSLDELSRATKIRRVFLEALEAERWEEMPGRIFVVGYLRAVAGHLRLDALDWMGSLEAAWPAAPQEPPHPADAAPAVPADVPRRAASGLWLVGASVMLGLALLFFLLRPRLPGGEEPPASGRPAAAPPTRVETEAPPPVGPPRQTPPVVEAAVEAPAPRALPAEPLPPPRAPGEAGPPDAGAGRPSGDLFIDVSAPCWIELYRGGRRLVCREVQPGEHLSFDGAGYSLTLGDATAAKVYWKGVPVALPAEPGRVVRALALGEGAP